MKQSSIHEKYNKEELERLIIKENRSYLSVGRLYGVSDTYIKRVCKTLGIELPVRNKRSKDWTPANKGKRTIVFNCKYCNKRVDTKRHRGQKFCDISCQAKERIRAKYEHYLNNQEEYCRVQTMAFIKPHLLEEQNHQCAICNSPDRWNDKELTFVLDHVDGDASNNMKDNLRLLCPNCDSQLDTFKSRNKNSARKERYLKNYKN